MNLESGTIISQYKIISAIGKGGMGEVFLAQDTKLDRKVAIKFLNEEFSKDADKLNRFTQEAKAVSALNHPNILTVYEIGETDDTNYIVTEFIEGKTLRERLSHKDPLQLNAILKIGVQVSEALSAAHQAGIIHRDIKPENIMIRKDGYAKVLDFGLAKLSEPPASAGGEDATRVQVNTTPGMVMGTVSYMSPEQARGNPTDARTDLWSLGVVLYEMLAGKVPFTGETVNHTIVSILEKEPKLLDNVLDELQRIVRKSLTKDVDMRYQSARDMLIDLKNLRRELDIQGELERSTVPNRDLTGTATENATQMLSGVGESTISGQNVATQDITTSSSSLEYAVTQAKSHKLATAVAAVLLVAVIAAVGYFGLLSKGGSSKQIESIAVMPFVNESGNADVEYLSDGMTETLIGSLSQLPNLQVKARSSVFRYKGKDTDPKTIGMELNVQAILNGRVMQRGDQLTLSAELVDVTTENVIWSKRYDRRLADAQAVQSEIAQDVSARLRSKLAGEGEPGQKNQTVSPEAYQAYLKGRFYLSQDTEESLKKSVEQFSRAISLEPNYALAYAGLATVYAEISSQYLPPSEAMPKAKDAVLKALALDGSLAEAHLALAEIHWWSDWDFPAAEQEFKRAIELNPNEPKNYSLYGLFLARTLARFDEGKIMAERALQVDSLAPDVRSNIASVFYTSRQSDRVIEEANKLLELDRNSASGHRLLGGAYLLKGQYEQAIVELEKAVDREGGFGLERLGYAYAAAGRKNDALKKIAELQALAEKKYIPPMWFARIYVSLGDKERAFEWLEKAYAGRDDALTHLKTDPLLDSLRSDPRFTDLMRRVGLPQ